MTTKDKPWVRTIRITSNGETGHLMTCTTCCALVVWFPEDDKGDAALTKHEKWHADQRVFHEQVIAAVKDIAGILKGRNTS